MINYWVPKRRSAFVCFDNLFVVINVQDNHVAFIVYMLTMVLVALIWFHLNIDQFSMRDITVIIDCTSSLACFLIGDDAAIDFSCDLIGTL